MMHFKKEEYLLEKLATPVGETIVLILASEKLKNEQAVLAKIFRYEDDANDYFAIRCAEMPEDGDVTSARFSITTNAFQFSVTKKQSNQSSNVGSVKLGPTSTVSVTGNLANRGLGSFGYSRCIEYIQKKYSDYSVASVSLSSNFPNEQSEWERRNHFYQNFNFELEFSDENNIGSGRAKAASVSVLTTHYPKNLRELTLVEFQQEQCEQKRQKQLAQKADEKARAEKALQFQKKSNRMRFLVWIFWIVVLITFLQRLMTFISAD
jgi:hypothetical protein